MLIYSLLKKYSFFITSIYINLYSFSNCRCMLILKKEKKCYKIHKKLGKITSKKKEQLLYSCNCNNDLTLVLWMVYYYGYVLLNHNTQPPLQPHPPPSSMHQPLGLRPWLFLCVWGGEGVPPHYTPFGLQRGMGHSERLGVHIILHI